MSRFALEKQYPCLSNAPLPAVPAAGSANRHLGHTFLAGVPRALSENSTHLEWMGFTSPRKG